jgi:hypothetical protein
MKWLSLLVAAGLVFGLCGCGQTGTVEGPEGKKLTLRAPADTTIKQGDSKDVTVLIARTKFDAPVDVKIDDLPKGVKADETKKTIEKGATSVKFTLTAAGDANPEEGHKVKVLANTTDMKEGPLEFTLNVKKK